MKQQPVLASTATCAHLGVDSYLVRVEARVTRGLPRIDIVGLPDAAVREGKERVRSALRAALGIATPGRILVNLSPASRRKAGASFDLAIAVAVLAATEHLCEGALAGTVFFGELGLDGRVHPVPGALPAALACAAGGRRCLVLCMENALEAAVAPGIKVFGVSSLGEVVELIANGFQRDPVVADVDAMFKASSRRHGVDFSEVRGQPVARRAMEIAAAGAHHVLLCGPPGAGKTMLAKRLPTILPPLTMEEAIETTSIYSIAGLNRSGCLMTRRPFRAPHHTTSGPGMVGGGLNPRPGEISLAHNGVLFLDELPEFAVAILNQLREPIEDGRLTICRVGARFCFPASFMLVAAMNPCPCGYFATGCRSCSCAESSVQRYLARLSGPLLDRIDMYVDVPRVEFAELWKDRPGESSAAIRERVLRARDLDARLQERDRSRFMPGVVRFLARAADRMGLSARATQRTTRVATTIARLAGREEIGRGDLAEALQYRPTLPGAAAYRTALGRAS